MGQWVMCQRKSKIGEALETIYLNLDHYVMIETEEDGTKLTRATGSETRIENAPQTIYAQLSRPPDKRP